MSHIVTYKLYRVTFRDGTTTTIRASNPLRASLAVSRNHGADIASMELVAVDTGIKTREDARRELRKLTGLSTRKMQSLPANVLLRAELQPSRTARVTEVRNNCVTFKIGGAY